MTPNEKEVQVTAPPAVPSEPPLTDEAPPINSERLAEIRLLFVTPTRPEHHDDWLARVCMQSDAALELLMALDIAVLQATAAREEITALRAREDDTDAVLEAALPGWSPDRPPAEGVQQLAEERDKAEHEADTWWRRSEKQVDVIADLTAERDKARPDREAAKARLHPVLHELDVRITDLPGDCHCNLVAEVILDALYGREGQTEEGADRGE